MARDQEAIQCPNGVYTQLTTEAVDEVSFQPVYGDVWIKYTQDATQPAPGPGWEYKRGLGEAARDPRDFTVWDAPSNVWAMPIASSGSTVPQATVLVDHA